MNFLLNPGALLTHGYVQAIILIVGNRQRIVRALRLLQTDRVHDQLQRFAIISSDIQNSGLCTVIFGVLRLQFNRPVYRIQCLIIPFIYNTFAVIFSAFLTDRREGIGKCMKISGIVIHHLRVTAGHYQQFIIIIKGFAVNLIHSQYMIV